MGLWSIKYFRCIRWKGSEKNIQQRQPVILGLDCGGALQVLHKLDGGWKSRTQFNFSFSPDAKFVMCGKLSHEL